MKNRVQLLSVSLATLMVISIGLYYLSYSEPRSSFDRNIFTLDEPEKIDEVIFETVGGQIDLKFADGKWKVNDRFDADPQMVKVLFAALSQVEVRRPLAIAMRDSIKEVLQKSGTGVELLEGGVSKLKFRAGGNIARTEAWFLKENDTQPYSVIIPGYRVYVSGILEMDEGGWRNKRVFDFNWMNFKSLSANFVDEPRQNFEVIRKNRFFGIKDMEQVDTAKLNTYLDDLSLLFASRFVASNNRTDSLSKVRPNVRIEMRDIGDRPYKLELFNPKKDERQVYGRIGDDQWMLIDRSKAMEIARKRAYFSKASGN